ncbi:MAG: NADH-quinone oxidoreductase subunit I [Alicyclobacillus sp.]|nr:NADH-quinone oxidoreductase subunit I [Alicyclobacillus sp.]
MFGFLKGLGVTLSQLPRKKVTLQYPDVMPVWPERFRGVHRFIPELCIVCNQCARICPTDCISLSGSRDENKKLRIDTYDINFDICILCDPGTEVCPTDAILMSDTFELATYSREEHFLSQLRGLFPNRRVRSGDLKTHHLISISPRSFLLQ